MMPTSVSSSACSFILSFCLRYNDQIDIKARFHNVFVNRKEKCQQTEQRQFSDDDQFHPCLFRCALSALVGIFLNTLICSLYQQERKYFGVIEVIKVIASEAISTMVIGLTFTLLVPFPVTFVVFFACGLFLKLPESNNWLMISNGFILHVFWLLEMEMSKG